MMTRKPIQLTVKMSLFDLTYFVVCDDGAMFWAQPKHGKDIDWKQISGVPQSSSQEIAE